MAIRSSTTKNFAEGAGEAMTGDAPSGFSAGDRLLAWLIQDTTATHTGPTAEGWTKLADANTSADGQTATLWEKPVASGSETFAFTSSSLKRAMIQIVALTGRHASNAAIVSTPTIQNTGQASPASIALTGITALAGDDLLWFAQADQLVATDVWSFGSLSTFTVLQDSSNSDWISAATFKKENVSAGATGTLTATATRTSGAGNTGWSGVVVGIPASAGGGGGPTTYYFNDSVEM